MVLQLLDPLVGLRRFDHGWRGHRLSLLDRGRAASWAVPIDVVEEDGGVVIKASMPGIAPEDIEVTVEGNVVTVKGQTESENEERNCSCLTRERKAGGFYRAVRLPDAVEADRAETSYEHGVVSITFPKQESRKPRRLEIKAGKN